MDYYFRPYNSKTCSQLSSLLSHQPRSLCKISYCYYFFSLFFICFYFTTHENVCQSFLKHFHKCKLFSYNFVKKKSESIRFTISNNKILQNTFPEVDKVTLLNLKLLCGIYNRYIYCPILLVHLLLNLRF